MQHPRDISRELISLSRQGGISLRDRFAKNQNDDAGSKSRKQQTQSDKKASKQPTSQMSKSRSAPTLTAKNTALSATKGSDMSGTRRGGGWNRVEVPDMTKYMEVLEKCAEMNINLDFCEKPFYRTALWEATWKNYDYLVKLLTSRGASIAKADYQGRTPLHEAAYYGHLNLVEFFLDKGHPINCADAFGQTPLFRAAEAGRSEVVRFLVNRGAQMNNLDNDSCNVAHIAAFRGLPILSDFLYCSGAHRNRFSIEKTSDTVPDIFSLKSSTKSRRSSSSLLK
jgi:hypothetical protein